MAVAQGSFAVPTYTAGSARGAVATPTFSPAAGTYYSTQMVTISTATPLAVLCYTTDGSTPTETGNLCSGGTTQTYTSPVSVASSLTLKAIGTLATGTDSAVGSAAYTIVTGALVCPAVPGATYDTFAGTSGTAMATYNSCWVNLTSSYVVANENLNGSNQVTNTVYLGGGAYTGDTSSTAQMIIGPNTVVNTAKYVCVRSNPGTAAGYCAGNNSWNSTSTTSIELLKNGGFLAGITGCPTMNQQTTSYAVAIVAIGTSSVLLTAYVNGTACTGTYTDSSSAIASGTVGFYTYYQVGSLTAMGKFCDYFC
jgi:hypothetical protein